MNWKALDGNIQPNRWKLRGFSILLWSILVVFQVPRATIFGTNMKNMDWEFDAVCFMPCQCLWIARGMLKKLRNKSWFNRQFDPFKGQSTFFWTIRLLHWVERSCSICWSPGKCDWTSAPCVMLYFCNVHAVFFLILFPLREVSTSTTSLIIYHVSLSSSSSSASPSSSSSSLTTSISSS